MTFFFRRGAAAVATTTTAAVTVLALTPAHAAAPAADTSAALTWTSTQAKVKVTSPRTACESGRRTFVVLSREGDTGAATGTTGDNGVVRFETTPTLAGTMRAFVARTPACRPAQSNSETRQPSGTRAAARSRTTAVLTTTETGFRVKVESPNDACAAGRKVDVLQYSPRSGVSEADVLSGTTNGNGVARLDYEFNPRQRGAALLKATAFVRATAACNVGQANTLTSDLD